MRPSIKHSYSCDVFLKSLTARVSSVSQRQQNALKYVTEEWASIEYELLRERGLWGPPIGSHLDKFVLEMTEGPCRMRKKMVRNDMFYIHYPYIPETETSTNSAQVTSVDLHLYLPLRHVALVF